MKTRIKEIMDDNGITIEEMADVLDRSEKSVEAYYRGYRVPGKEVALNMAKILDVSVSYLLGTSAME